MEEQYDVVVVGGGPAGSTVGTLIAAQGHRVLILERERFPRYQIGESLLPSTIHGICKLLGVQAEVEAAGFLRKRGGTFRWGVRSIPWSFDWEHHPLLREEEADYAYQVERAKFDNILLQNARRKGCTVREQCTVVGVIKEGERVAGVRYLDENGGERQVGARYLVDGSGNTSSLHTLAGERIYSKFFQNVALFGYFEGGGRLPEPRQNNILCAAFAEGWFWYIPLSDKLTSVGAVIAREHAEKLKQGHEAALADFIDACPQIRELLANARRVTEGIYGSIRVRKDYSYNNSKFWSPGLVLIGDAACFIDPVFSSGVHLATYSALLAARSINTCLAGKIDEKPAFEEFERRYRLEYDVFYEYLIRFYDMYESEDSYFWSARKILKTQEASHEAFMRLVAGGGTTSEEFFRQRGDWLGEMIGVFQRGGVLADVPFVSATRAEQRRIIEGAHQAATEEILPGRLLMPSADGAFWVVRP